jgi:hypothetical protein
MSNLTSILGTDLISNAPSVLNGNFDALNHDILAGQARSSVLTASIAGLKTISVSSANGVALPLTTSAGDKVVVWAKGLITGTTNVSSVALMYNGVIKDVISLSQSADFNTNPLTFSLMYSEVPGAQSASIMTSVVSNIGGTTILSNVKILTELIS